MVAKSMIERGVKGSIINISSQVGHVGGPLRSAYAGAKGGLTSLTRSLARSGRGTASASRGFPHLHPHRDDGARGAEPRIQEKFEKVPLGRPAELEEIAAR
jgi:NAD(P)-dependent dehydrogenase (short-subunit alcohol dehydrogenase family)